MIFFATLRLCVEVLVAAGSRVMVIVFLISACQAVIGVKYFMFLVREVGWDVIDEIGFFSAEWITFFMLTILAVGTTVRHLVDFYPIQQLRAGK